MKYLLYFVATFSLLSFSSAVNDDCETYFPLEKGMKWEYEVFDKNGKLQGYSSTSVTEVKSIATGAEYNMKVVSDDAKKKEKSHFERDLTYTCEDGVLKMNLEGLIPSETMKGMESMTIKIDQTEMTIPRTLTVGQALPDAAVRMTAETSGIQVMDMNIKITNRKVEKLESVTTGAGTYNCALVTYTTSTKMSFIDNTMTTKDWYSSEVGIVKSESYDKNGVLSSSRKLTGFSK
ncbi:MAG: hypothetical protein ACI857_003168 [Arenicella sp.]|jgi:hypothetical protein